MPILRALLMLLLSCLPVAAQDVADLAPRPGWVVLPSPHDPATLVARIEAAVADQGLAVVTRAGPTAAAARRGIEIPDNMVIGVFNNDLAVRILRASTAAMIHAPLRLYVTGNADGTATLSYIPAGTIFAPYAAEGGAALADAVDELDAHLAAIAERAVAR